MSVKEITRTNCCPFKLMNNTGGKIDLSRRQTVRAFFRQLIILLLLLMTLLVDGSERKIVTAEFREFFGIRLGSSIYDFASNFCGAVIPEADALTCYLTTNDVTGVWCYKEFRPIKVMGEKQSKSIVAIFAPGRVYPDKKAMVPIMRDYMASLVKQFGKFDDDSLKGDLEKDAELIWRFKAEDAPGCWELSLNAVRLSDGKWQMFIMLAVQSDKREKGTTVKGKSTTNRTEKLPQKAILSFSRFAEFVKKFQEQIRTKQIRDWLGVSSIRQDKDGKILGQLKGVAIDAKAFLSDVKILVADIDDCLKENVSYDAVLMKQCCGDFIAFAEAQVAFYENNIKVIELLEAHRADWFVSDNLIKFHPKASSKLVTEYMKLGDAVVSSIIKIQDFEKCYSKTMLFENNTSTLPEIKDAELEAVGRQLNNGQWPYAR